MPEDYHDISGTEEVSTSAELKIPRAQALVVAVEKQRDFSIVRLLRRVGDGTEYVIVDVENDGVPSRHPHIMFKERLALCVSANPKHLVDVRAMRKDFPILLHQNQVVPGDAPSLCLYFEPPMSVLRTWTPQSFLRRIQWWLEKVAKDELHPADQPVEHLFFATKYELILPWNFDDLSKTPGKNFIINMSRRPDGGATFSLQVQKGAESSNAKCLEFTLEPVVHGVVENHPTTLGQLDALLRRRGGGNLVDAIKESVADLVGTEGALATSDLPHTIFLLHIPMCRVPGEEPEGVSHSAFLINTGILKLGADLGVLFEINRKYQKVHSVAGASLEATWHTQEIFPVDVRQENNKEAARKQSGIQDEGSQGVLVGAGALGSAMINLWARSGWGKWSTIDKDHLKPHNLSRHTAYTFHIGQPKVDAVSDLYGAAMRDGEVIPVYGDACDLGNPKILSPLQEADLIVDASTTLEYPRLASSMDDLGRHISVFLTPTGNSSVLLAEDQGRALRLRTLEAQYYRAIIESEWGEGHLEGHNGTFWSGASCRDISTVMPYSRIVAHAATLAEQVAAASRDTEAVIRIWERCPDTGSVTLHDIQACNEKSVKLGDLDVYFDAGVEAQLRALRTDHLPNETGGVLLGYHDFNIKAIFIVGALPAPQDSKSCPASFERGTEGLIEKIRGISDKTSGVVGYIGEWHTHPKGCSATPSGDDFIQLKHLALEMDEDGLPAIQLIVGESDIQILQAKVLS